MRPLLSGVACAAVALVLVSTTSPTVRSSILEPHSLGPLKLQALFADFLFAALVALILLCQLHPRAIAEHQAFPYCSQPQRNFGPEAFDFSLLAFETFHQNKCSRIVHAVGLVTEGLAWLLIAHGTFGPWANSSIVLATVLQAASFGDLVLAASFSSLLICFGLLTWVATSALDTHADALLSASKATVVWFAVSRVIVHAFEPLPPAYETKHASYQDHFGPPAWNLLFQDPARCIVLVMFGLPFEIDAGLPGRFLIVVVYKLLYHGGYRSNTLLDVNEARLSSKAMITKGWQAHPTMATLFTSEKTLRRDAPKA
jgi:hypothetical protein